MKSRVFSLILSFVMAAQLCGFTVTYAETENDVIIANPGFEEELAGWSVNKTALYSANKDEKRTGEASLQIQVPEESKKNWNKISQTINVAAGKTYALSFYSKFVSGKGVHHIDGTRHIYTIPETEWTKHTEVFTTQNDTVTIGFGNYYGEQATFYVDDVELTEVDAAATSETVLNGDFENDVDGLGWAVADADVFGISENEKFSGSRALRLMVEADQNKSYSVYYQNVSVVSGKSYQLTFYCKDAAGMAVVKVAYGTGKVAERHITKTGEWQKYTIEFVPEADNIKISVVNNVGSKQRNELYFDDFNLAFTKHTIYVSESGNDNGTGSMTEPLRTIEEAKKRIKALRETIELPCEVVFRAGTYRIGNTINFDESNSGSETAPITYMAYEGEKVKFKGSVEIDYSKASNVTDMNIKKRLRDDVADKIVSIDLKNDITESDIGSLKKISSYSPISGTNGYEYLNLYANDKEQMLAQWPNGKENFVRWEDVVTVGGKSESAQDLNVKGVFKYSGNVPDRWSNESDWWIGGYPTSDYRYERNSVYAIDTENKTITLATPTTGGLKQYGHYASNADRSRRWKAFNLPEEIDVPGEWYIDPENLILYYYPIDESLSSLELSVLKNPIVSIKNASYIGFSGIEFSQSRNYAIDMTDVSNITVDKCTFKNLDRGAIRTISVNKSQRDAVWWQKQYIDAANGSVISNCTFNNIGGTCISLSGGNVDTLTPGNCVIENNVIYDYSYNLGQSPAISVGGCGNIIRNNNISKGAFHAINYAGNDHKILYNEIYDVNRIVDDVGAIYSGRSYLNRGTEIAYNYIHDIQPQPVEGMNFGFSVGIYWDDSLCGQYAHHNIIKDALVGVYSCGQHNRFDNNVLINCTRKNAGGINYSTNYEKSALDESGRVAKTWRPQYDSLEDKTIYSEKYSHFDEGLQDEYAVINAWAEIKGNINVNSDTFIAPSVYTYGEYEEYNVSECYDFNDAANGDYTIKPNTETAATLPGLVNDTDGFAIKNMGLEKNIVLNNITNPITKIAPIENPLGNDVIFMWDNVLCANEYRIVISENSDFETALIDMKNYTNIAVINRLDKNKDYFWKVYAVNKSKKFGTVWESDVFKLSKESDFGYDKLRIKNGSGENVSSLDKITDGIIGISYDVVNCSDLPFRDAKVITAIYDSENRLVSAKVVSKTLKYQQYETVQADFELIPQNMSGFYANIMVWDDSQRGLRKKIAIR